MQNPDVQIQPSDGPKATNQQNGPSSTRELPFLLSYSAPGNRNPAESNRALTLLSTPDTREDNTESTLPSLELEVDQADVLYEDSWAFFFQYFQGDGLNGSSPLAGGLEDQAKRELATEKMIGCLRKTASDDSIRWQGFNIDSARALIHERNVGEFIEAYFEQTIRPRSRIVPKASFQVECVSGALLLAIFLMGALSSSSDSLKPQTAALTDIVECAIFESAVFLELSRRERSSTYEELGEISIEILQAAILIILIQIVSPNSESRRRVQFQRYPALVSIARTTSLTKVRNRWHGSDPLLSHSEFLKNETCIRLDKMHSHTQPCSNNVIGSWRQFQ